VYVGEKVVQFCIPHWDDIVDFISTEAGSGVPYAIAVGHQNVYFPSQGQIVPRSAFSGTPKAPLEFFEQLLRLSSAPLLHEEVVCDALGKRL